MLEQGPKSASLEDTEQILSFVRPNQVEGNYCESFHRFFTSYSLEIKSIALGLLTQT